VFSGLSLVSSEVGSSSALDMSNLDSVVVQPSSLAHHGSLDLSRNPMNATTKKSLVIASILVVLGGVGFGGYAVLMQSNARLSFGGSDVPEDANNTKSKTRQSQKNLPTPPPTLPLQNTPPAVKNPTTNPESLMPPVPPSSVNNESTSMTGSTG
jgi:hypothetical protein